jgi:hypothetical protein
MKVLAIGHCSYRRQRRYQHINIGSGIYSIRSNMNTLNNNKKINILDLPNEVLFAIFNKLNMTDVFYSLADINQQLNQLIFVILI